jgi:hypothetical protein
VVDRSSVPVTVAVVDRSSVPVTVADRTDERRVEVIAALRTVPSTTSTCYPAADAPLSGDGFGALAVRLDANGDSPGSGTGFGTFAP